MTVLAARIMLAGFAPGGFLARKILTAPPYGGWTQINDPKAVYYNGKTYFGYINGSNGNAEIRTYTHSTGIISSPFVLHAALDTPADTHDAPSILVRDSDKRLVVAYSAHNGASLFVRISTNAEDTSAWGSEITARGSGAFTYPFIMQRLSEANDPIYIWYRNGTGGSTVLTYSKSGNGGANWANGANVYSSGGANYWKITTDGLDRIDFVVTSGNPSEATSPIYHFYTDGSGYHASNGTDIGDPTFGPADLTQVYNSATGPGWPTDLYLNGSNQPRFVYSVDNGSLTDSAFRYARWTGSAWVLTNIITSVGAGIVDPSPVASLNPTTTDCYLTRFISGKWELWRYVTTDSGATWTGSAVTSTSTVDNLYPTNVKNHASDLATLWLAGDYVGAETDFDMGILGIPD